MEKPGLFIIPENVPAKFYIQHLYPYYIVKKVALSETILDVGFGDGYGAFYLAENAKRVIGVDCEEDNVKIAQNKYKAGNLTFKYSDAANLDLPSDSFDIVCSFQVIEHIREDLLLKFLKEVFRVLKPAGTFFVSTLNREISMKPGQPYKKNPYHEKEFNSAELMNLLRNVFTEVEVYGLNLTMKHRFFQRLKKIGIFNVFP
ncbi:MAG: class I SAM-dependent methyltransferase, partial [Candidatus Omnitrophica bacterium]|nr:class I SAM-dependent methyltransferase [Candidatus Omnitrophota bacterium]